MLADEKVYIRRKDRTINKKTKALFIIFLVANMLNICYYVFRSSG